ncbi:MAG: hypothetical protein QNJ47_15560 [Nostocaceae cyanobacterium]|nr:hypothetical protein [Nostocaceae cyanobacterium]
MGAIVSFPVSSWKCNLGGSATVNKNTINKKKCHPKQHSVASALERDKVIGNW